ncbi:hypothetical protein BH11PSE13_BH11PSE13_10960 [soil metagenome]
MQCRNLPSHRQPDRDLDSVRSARISNFIRDARSGRDALQLQSRQLPLGLIPIPPPSPLVAPLRVQMGADAFAPAAADAMQSDIRAYDPAPLANMLIAQAQAAIEQLGRLLIANDERIKQLRLYDDAEVSPTRPALDGAARLAVDACLASASALLGVTRALHNRLPDPTPQECVEESSELTELTKAAGRAAYRAALLIVDPDFHPVSRPASHRITE